MRPTSHSEFETPALVHDHNVVTKGNFTSPLVQSVNAPAQKVWQNQFHQWGAFSFSSLFILDVAT